MNKEQGRKKDAIKIWLYPRRLAYLQLFRIYLNNTSDAQQFNRQANWRGRDRF